MDDPETGDVAVAVEREGVTDYILSSPGGGTREYGPVTMTGRFGFASVDGKGNLVRAFLLDGTELRCGGKKVSIPKARMSLRVASVQGRTFSLAEDAPKSALTVGAYLLAGNTGWEVESVAERSITVRDYPAMPCERVEALGMGEFLE